MSRQSHQLAGRVSAAEVPNMVSFCTCGRGFFGAGAAAADSKLDGHVQRVTAARQKLGELLSTTEPNRAALVNYLIEREWER